jgi:hypothetical protein
MRGHHRSEAAEDQAEFGLHRTEGAHSNGL